MKLLQQMLEQTQEAFEFESMDEAMKMLDWLTKNQFDDYSEKDIKKVGPLFILKALPQYLHHLPALRKAYHNVINNKLPTNEALQESPRYNFVFVLDSKENELLVVSASDPALVTHVFKQLASDEPDRYLLATDHLHLRDLLKKNKLVPYPVSLTQLIAYVKKEANK